MLEIALAAASVQDDLVTTELFAGVRNSSGINKTTWPSELILDHRLRALPSVIGGDLQMCPRRVWLTYNLLVR